MKTPIDWSFSETGISEIWKNPLSTVEENLIIADGAIAFRNKIIQNLRKQIEELKQPKK